MATGKHTFFGSKKAISKMDQCYVLKRKKSVCILMRRRWGEDEEKMKNNPLNTQISSLILLTV